MRVVAAARAAPWRAPRRLFSTPPDFASHGTTAHMLRDKHGVTFPWQFNDALGPRVARDTLLFRNWDPSTGLVSGLWTRAVRKPLAAALTRWVGERLLRVNLGADYWPDQFLQGVGVAAKPALEALSYLPGETPAIEAHADMFAPELRERLAAEFAKLAALPEKTGFEVAVDAVHDAEVKDIWVTFGPRRATQNPQDKGVIRFVTLKVAAEKINQGEIEDKVKKQIKAILPADAQITSANMYAIGPKVALQGVCVAVDVEVLVDLAVTVYRVPDKATEATAADGADQHRIGKMEPLYHEYSSRRPVTLRFTSPYFEPADRMSQARSSPTDGEGSERVWDWNWMVADIDYLLESERIAREEDAGATPTSD